jgi:glutathionyl-hydroquinone reductase
MASFERDTDYLPDRRYLMGDAITEADIRLAPHGRG